MTALATDKRNTDLVMTSDAIMDMNNNKLVEVPAYNATIAFEHIKDDSRPELVFFNLNLTSEILSMTFNEVVNASSLKSSICLFARDVICPHGKRCMVPTQGWCRIRNRQLYISIDLDIDDLMRSRN